jgi:ParB family chromosome partitioning protein
MSSKRDFGAVVSGRAQARAGSHLLGADQEPPRFATPLADDAFEVAIDHIRPSPDQPRKHFDEDELQQLAASIRRDGVLQPIPVNRTDDPSVYEIESGERRWRAATIAGLTTIPCIVREKASDRATIRRRQLTENIQRSDLKPIEAARSLEAYLREVGLSQREAAHDLSKPKTWVAELLGILAIPEPILAKIEQRERGGNPLPKRALVELAGIKDPKEQSRLFDRMIASDSPWTVAREARKRQTAEYQRPTFRRVMTHRDFPSYRLTVSAARPPEDVNPHDVKDFIGKVLSDYASKQSQGIGKPPPAS